MAATLRTLAVLSILALPALPAAAASYDSIAARLSRDTLKAGVTRVAVLPFSSMNGSDQAEGTHIAEQLATRMAAGGRVSVVERAMLPAVMGEHLLAAAGALDPKGLVRAGGLAQAEAVVIGSFLAVGEAVEVNLRVVRIDTGIALAARSAQLRRDWLPASGRVNPARPPAPSQTRRAAAAPRCAGVAERVDSMQAGILELKARYWADRLRRLGLSADSMQLPPDDPILRDSLRSRFYEVLWDETQHPGQPLSLDETWKFTSVDRRSFELLAECRK